MKHESLKKSTDNLFCLPQDSCVTSALRATGNLKAGLEKKNEYCEKSMVKETFSTLTRRVECARDLIEIQGSIDWGRIDTMMPNASIQSDSSDSRIFNFKSRDINFKVVEPLL